MEEGGGTAFPHLNLTVMPKRGSAVWCMNAPRARTPPPRTKTPRPTLDSWSRPCAHVVAVVVRALRWPHGFDDNPWRKDDRTHHEAMPVLKGVKMAANYWIHGSDFKRSMALGCDGRAGQPRRVWRK